MAYKRLHTKLIIPALILLPFFFMAGCSSWTAFLSDPANIYKQAREGVQAAHSFRMEGVVKMRLKTKTMTHSSEMRYQFLYEKGDNGESMVWMTAFMELPGNPAILPQESGGGGMEIEGYIAGNRIYMRLPGSGQWVYQEMDIPSQYLTLDQGMMPEDVVKFLDSAEKVEVLEDSEGDIRYLIHPDPEKLMQPHDLESLKEYLSRRGLPEEHWDNTVEMIRDMLSRIKLTITVERQSGLLTSLEMEVNDIKPGEAFPVLERNNFLRGASMSLVFQFTISDYGKTFDIRLPEEAKNAVPREDILDNLKT